MQAKFRDEPKVEIVEGDILKADLSQWTPAAVAGNLPYYITSPILERVLSLRGQWPRAVFLVQKEVAERLNAAPGTRDYGFLSVQTQFYAQVEMLMNVPPGAFRPPPKVDSAVVRLDSARAVTGRRSGIFGFAEPVLPAQAQDAAQQSAGAVMRRNCWIRSRRLACGRNN